jgi:hypothetical protein
MHSQRYATARAILEEQQARMRQAWQEYQESYMEGLWRQVYVRSVCGDRKTQRQAKKAENSQRRGTIALHNLSTAAAEGTAAIMDPGIVALIRLELEQRARNNKTADLEEALKLCEELGDDARTRRIRVDLIEHLCGAQKRARSNVRSDTSLSSDNASGSSSLSPTRSVASACENWVHAHFGQPADEGRPDTSRDASCEPATTDTSRLSAPPN